MPISICCCHNMVWHGYELVAYQPGTSVAYMRTDVPPGIKDASDIARTTGVVAGGPGAENSKDLRDPHIVSTILPKCLFSRMCACASTAWSRGKRRSIG